MATADAVDDGRGFGVEENSSGSHRHGTSDELIDPWCDLCYDETNRKIEAVGFCEECNTFVCKPCLDAHKRWPALQNHRIRQGVRMPKTQADKPVKYLDCNTHKGNVNDHFCLQHGEMLCIQCISETHKACKQTTISELCKELDSANILALQNAIETIKQYAISIKTSVKQNSDDIENQRNNMIKEAKLLRDSLISKIENMFSNIVSDVNQTCLKKGSNLSNQILALSDVITSLEQATASIAKISDVDIGPNVFIQFQNIVAHARKSRRELDELNKQLNKVNLSFSANPDIAALLSGNDPLGSVKEVSSQLDTMKPIPEIVFPSPLRPMIKITTQAGRKPRDISQIKATKLTPFNVKTGDDIDTSMAYGIDVTRNGILLLADLNNKKVKVFSPDSKLLSSLTLSGLPYDITVIDDKTAAVGTSDGKLDILDISDPRSLSIQRSVELGYLAGGLAPCNNNIVVTTWLTGPSCVKMIDLNGQELWSASSDHNGHKLFEEPYYVTTNIINNKLTIIVTDWDKDTISLLDANNGELIKTVDVKDKAPCGLTVDCNGNVFICYNTPTEICVWSADFSESRILLSSSDLQPRPGSIVYCNSTDELLICYDGMDTVDRFQLS